MNQRRRHSPAVYRRRRLAAALLAVFVLALVVWGARGLIDTFSSEDDPEQTADPAVQTQDDDAADPEATGEPEPTDEDAADPETDEAAAEKEDVDDEAQDEASDRPEGSCAPGDIAVRASTNQESYGSDVAPLLIMEVENTGSEDCTLDVGTAEQVFRVSHGGREIFNTAQCGSTGNSLEMEFEPGQTERAHLTWPRSDSSTDCTEPAELTTGDYELAVAVSGLGSDPHSFHVTGVEP